MLKAFTDRTFLTSLQEQVKEVGTIGSAFQVFRNELTLYIGEADRANGASKVFSSTILGLSENIDILANIALAALSVSLIKSTQAKLASFEASRLEAIAERQSLIEKQALAKTNLAVAKSALDLAIATDKSTISLNNNAKASTLAYSASNKKRIDAIVTAQKELDAINGRLSASSSRLGSIIGAFGGFFGIAVTGAILFSEELGNLFEQVTGLTPEIEKLAKARQFQTNLREAGVQARDEFAEEKLQLVQLQEELERTLEKRLLLEDALSKGKLQPRGLQELIQLFKILGTGGIKTAEDALKGFDAEIQKTQNSINELTKKISGETFIEVEPPKIDQKFIDNLKEQIQAIASANKLIAQGLPLEDANFIAKAKVAGANDELVVTYLNLASVQKKYLDDRKKEEDLTNQLTKLKEEEIPQLKEINNLLRQGVPLEDAQVIAKFKNIDASGKLTVSYLNLKNEQKALTEEQEKYNKLIEDAKKLNEEYLDPVIKVTQGIERLQSLLGKGLNVEGFGGGVRELIDDYNKATNQLFDFESVYQNLTETVSESFNPQDKDRVLELVASYRALEQQLKDGELGIVEFTEQGQELLKSFDAQAKSVEKLNEIINNTDAKKLEEQRNLIKAIYDEYALGTNEALDSVEELTEAVNSSLGRQSETIQDTTDFMEAAFRRAAENIQDTLADFLFDPFEDGLDGMLLNFVNVLRRMASEALAVAIIKKLFDVDDAKNLTSVIENSFEGLLDKFKNIFKDFNFSSLFGGSGSDSGLFSSIGNFFGGFFANGGDPPINKISVVGERGPELFVPRTAGTIIPNNMLGAGNQQTTNLSVKNINVLDPSIVGDYLRTDEGERLIINTMQRNKYAFQ